MYAKGNFYDILFFIMLYETLDNTAWGGVIINKYIFFMFGRL